MRQRCLYRARGNIDDPAEAPADHAIDDGFDHHDWRDHVGIDRTHPCRFIPVAKIADRWTASIVDKDVGLGASTEDSLSALAGRYIGGNCADANTRFTADRLSRRFEECGSSPIDDDVDTLTGERQRAASAEAFARCTDDCFPSFNTQVHRRALLPFVTATAPPAGRRLVHGTVLHDRDQSIAVLQNADVSQRITVDEDKVCEEANPYLAELLRSSHDCATPLCRRDDGIHGREP